MFLVIGVTGKVGRRVAAGLVDAGGHVRGLVRDGAAADVLDGVEPVVGDLLVPGSLDAALRGVTRVFLIWPTGSPADAQEAVERLAHTAGRIVYLSTVGVDDSLERQTHPLSEMHAVVEKAIRAVAHQWTILRATKFATNTLAWAPSIRAAGVVEGTYGTMRRSPIDERDVADVAVHALLDEREGRTDRSHVISGPESLTEEEQVEVLGDVLGRSIRWVEVEPEEARRRMIAGGTPVELADAAIDYWRRFTTHPEPVTRAVADITGHPARTFRDWAEDHRELFG